MPVMTLSQLKRQGRGASRHAHFRSLSADSGRSLDGSNNNKTGSANDPPSSGSKYNKKTRPSSPRLLGSTNTILAILILVTQVMLFAYLILHSKVANDKGFDMPSLTLPAEIDAFFSSSSNNEGASSSSNDVNDKPAVEAIHEKTTKKNQPKRIAPRTPAQSSLVPFSKLLEINAKESSQHGAPRPTLTGTYSLGKDHFLQKSLASSTAQHVLQNNLNPDEVATGSILFPFADLVNMMPEEKDAQQLQLRGSNHRSGKGREQEDDEHDSETLLTFDTADSSSFKSVLWNDKNAFSPDQAVLTRRGLKEGRSYNSGPTINQDRAFIANFNIELKQQQQQNEESTYHQVQQKEDQTVQQQEHVPQHEQQDQQPSALLMGVFDGHGRQGQEVSHYVAVEFARIFASSLRSKPRKNQNSLDAFHSDTVNTEQSVQTISKALAFAFTALDQGEPIKGNSGSTASTLFYPGVGSKVYIANAGDSSTLIVRYSKSSRRTSIAFQNRKHTADLRDEANRIKKAGGYIMKPPPNFGNKSPGVRDVSKVIISDRSKDRKSSTGVGLALTTSRAIGDYDGKAEGITAEPEVSVWNVKQVYDQHGQYEDDSEWFAIVGSDGLFDVLAPDIVAAYLGVSLYSDEQDNISLSPLDACERLIHEGSRLWNKAPIGGYRYRDDITLGVSKLYFNL